LQCVGHGLLAVCVAWAALAVWGMELAVRHR